MGVRIVQKETLFKNERGFVGAYLPPYLIDFLHLLCAKENISVQNLLSQCIEREYQQQPEIELLNDIVGQAVKAWDSEAQPKTAKARKEYLNEIQRKLQKKKVNKETIAELIRRIENEVKS